jgi:hypothetical protein
VLSLSFASTRSVLSTDFLSSGKQQAGLSGGEADSWACDLRGCSSFQPTEKTGSLTWYGLPESRRTADGVFRRHLPRRPLTATTAFPGC